MEASKSDGPVSVVHSSRGCQLEPVDLVEVVWCWGPRPGTEGALLLSEAPASPDQRRGRCLRRPVRLPQPLSPGDSLLPAGDMTHAADHWPSTADTLPVNEPKGQSLPVENWGLRGGACRNRTYGPLRVE